VSPYLSHPLTALLRYAIFYSILRFAFAVPGAEWFALAYVGAYFEGREAGQREHDLKHFTQAGEMETWSPFEAWAGSAFFFGWSLPNILQALAGIAPAFVVTVLIAYLGRL
jgi:hypothetical protein